MEKSEKIKIIEKSLDLIRPYLEQDGGDIELVDITDDDVLKVRFEKSCMNCKFKRQTLLVVEKHVRKYYTELSKIEEVISLSR